MTQHNNIKEEVREYTRTDFAALRFRLTGINTPAIMRLYTEDELANRGISTATELITWIDEVRDHLVERAKQANPRVAELLDNARNRGAWPKGVMDFITEAGERDRATPKLTDGVSVWFKPIVFRTLANEGLHTLGDLKNCMEARGSGWYRPIPRLGAGKAQVFERWFAAHQESLGTLTLPPDKPLTAVIELNPDAPNPLTPLERIGSVARTLDGSQGRNRNEAFCLIAARTDLDAIHAYLYRYRGRDKTLRAYQKELERFLLWCVCKRRQPLSSVLTEECEAYKAFLGNPDPSWVGTKAPRSSTVWRPFEGPLSASSQKYAVQVIRTFFEWLVRVRYLGGNPWITVSDPSVEEKEFEMAIDKALPEKLWAALTNEGGVLDCACEQYAGTRLAGVGAMAANPDDSRGAQYRLVRAIVFMLGFTGVRREEAAFATRDKLKPVQQLTGPSPGLWELAVLGKRKKWRTVYLPARVIDALRAHWEDRGHDFLNPNAEQALLSPVVIPNTPLAQQKHVNVHLGGGLTGHGFSPDGLYKVIKNVLLRLADDPDIPLKIAERELLKQATPHAFRHTFATRAAAKLMPLDILQRLLGHSSQQTTAIYVQAERARSIEESAKFFES